MRKFYTLMVSVWVLLLTCSEAIAQAPSPDWTKLYAGPTGRGAAARHIKVVNGFVYVAGAGDGVHVVRYDSQNPSAPVLVMSYPGAEYAYDLEVDASGNVYAAARSKASLKGNSIPNYDFVTIKFKPDGSLHWARTYAGSKGVADCPQALAVDNGGNVFVTGGAEGLNASNAFAVAVTLKYNSSGDLQWVARMDDIDPGNIAVAGGGYESAQDITIDGNGDVYITGESNRAMVIAKYAGNYAGPGNNPVIWKDVITEGTSGRSIGVSNNNIIAVGFGGAIASYSNTGTRGWVRKYGSAFWDMALNGSAIHASGSSSGQDILTVKYDLNGNLQWDKTFNASTNTAYSNAIAVDACGNVFITGRVSVQEGRNLVEKLPVIKYSETGNLDWVTYNGSMGFDIATDAAGAVYVTGMQYGRNAQNFITAKYPGSCISQTVSPFSTMEESGLNSVNNYPNPFRISTDINFRLAKAGNVSLNVFDLTGRRIQTLIQGQRNAGQHTIKFSGNNLPAGIYIYRLEADGYSKSGRMILEK